MRGGGWGMPHWQYTSHSTFSFLFLHHWTTMRHPVEDGEQGQTLPEGSSKMTGEEKKSVCPSVLLTYSSHILNPPGSLLPSLEVASVCFFVRWSVRDTSCLSLRSMEGSHIRGFAGGDTPRIRVCVCFKCVCTSVVPLFECLCHVSHVRNAE